MTQELALRLNDSLFSPDNSTHYENLALKLAKSNVIPKNYIGKPTDLYVAMAMGYQLGMPVEQAIQDIAVINGRPCLYGDGLLAVVMSHPDFVDIIEAPIMSDKGEITGYQCTIQRRNKADYSYCYTLIMAKRAGLLGKPGPWSQYPERMLQMRARAFCCRDRFPDALRGIKLAEEVMDYVDGEVVKPTETGLSHIEKLKKNLGLTEGDGYDRESESEICDVANQVHQDDNSKDVPIGSETPAVQGIMPEKVGETGTEENQILAHLATVDQIDLMDQLITEKQFSDERIEKALRYYEVISFADLTQEKANHFIKQLQKE